METEKNPELVCVDCSADFRWLDSPDPDRCEWCAAWHAWWIGVRGQGVAA